MLEPFEYRLAILTTSDAGAKGERVDTSGDAISEIMSQEGFREVHRDIIPDERGMIADKLKGWCDGGQVDLVLTTGGTGLGPRDVTPDATRDVIEMEVPGISEVTRLETWKSTQMSVLSRTVAGVRSRCLIINLPGSPKGVQECLAVITPVVVHAIEIIKGRTGHPVQ